MFALWVIEHLNVIEHVLPRVNFCLVGFTSDTFALEQVEEALGDSVVVTVSTAAHAVFKIVLLQK